MNEPDTTIAPAGEPALDPKVAADRQMLREARAEGKGSLFKAFVKLSGPGWLQSAITLGGGSLAGGLFLGIIAGTSLMWLQPLAMLMGIIMLSVIGYVTLSTGERPFRAINKHINPVLGWGWIVATMMANMVWCMPQFGLAMAALRGNLGVPFENWVLALGIAVLAVLVIWFYNSGSKGIHIFEILVKGVVALIVISFIGVVVAMTVTGDLQWGQIMRGFIPDLRLLSEPAPMLKESVARTGEFAAFWTEHIVREQRDVMITAAATAVGINMTFLLPYSMLARGWDKDFRGMAIFDLATGLFIPFILVTTCIVIAAAAQFHNQPASGVKGETDPDGALMLGSSYTDSSYTGIVTKRMSEAGIDVAAIREAHTEYLKGLQDRRKDEEMSDAEFGDLLIEGSTMPEATRLAREALRDRLGVERGDEAFIGAALATPVVRNGPLDQAMMELPEADREVAAAVTRRNAFDLAGSLEPLTGRTVAHLIFGIGVVGVAFSSIIILMLINGFVFCEVFDRPGSPGLARTGSILVVIVGALGALFLWGGAAQFWLAVPTSVFGMALAPIAYLAFFLMMNNSKLLGEYMPRGIKRFWWNALMAMALTLATVGASWAIWGRDGDIPGTDIQIRWAAIGLIGFLVVLGLVIHFVRRAAAPQPTA